jgi:hypothetical protein
MDALHTARIAALPNAPPLPVTAGESRGRSRCRNSRQLCDHSRWEAPTAINRLGRQMRPSMRGSELLRREIDHRALFAARISLL